MLFRRILVGFEFFYSISLIKSFGVRMFTRKKSIKNYPERLLRLNFF